MPPMIQLVAFLGNTGLQYRNNRHNVGWLFADNLNALSSLSWQSKFKGQVASLERRILCPEAEESGKVFFLKPETFMNLSGQSIRAAADFHKIKAEEILLVHDELELPFGWASFKFSGGLGGHNGLRSMRDHFTTADFWRLRIGIGRPSHRDIASYVLSDFNTDEDAVLDDIITLLEAPFTQAICGKPERLLPEWNKKALLSF